MDIAIWNVLHDGTIEGVDGVLPGDLRLTVEIEYLCGELPTKANHLLLELSSCEQFEYRPYGRTPITDPPAIAALGLDILSAFQEGECMALECADGSYGGQLLVRCAAARAAAPEGTPLSQQTLESAAERYWEAWSRRTK